MKTYITLDHARKVPRFLACARMLDIDQNRPNFVDPKTGVIVVRSVKAIPRKAKRVTPFKENLKSLGWFILSVVSYAGIMGAIIYCLGA